jgi:thiamine monophosphate synthase
LLIYSLFYFKCLYKFELNHYKNEEIYKLKDFYFKKQQGCTAVLLSPIFETKKYSKNFILNVQKFNLICKNWQIQVYALAGINEKNLKKLNITNAKGFGGISFFNLLNPLFN